MEKRISARLKAAEGRKFAFTLAVAFAVVGAIFWWREREAAVWVVGIVAGLFFTAGLLIPSHLGPVQRAWMALAHAISKVTTPIVMAVLYYGVLTPTGMIRRTLGRSPLLAPSGRSVWQKRDPLQRRSDLRRPF